MFKGGCVIVPAYILSALRSKLLQAVLFLVNSQSLLFVYSSIKMKGANRNQQATEPMKKFFIFLSLSTSRMEIK